MFTLTIAKDGLRHTRDVEADDERVSEMVVAVPTTVPDLLRFWHWTLDGIDDGVTLGDLVDLLAAVKGIDTLSGLLECDVAVFLAEAALPGVEPVADVWYIEVINFADRTKHASDAVGRALQPLPPYRLTRECHGWGLVDESDASRRTTEADGAVGGGVGIDFVPIAALRHLPLRYNSRVTFANDDAGGRKAAPFEARIAITFGKFVHAIFWELGFYGGPAARDAMVAQLLKASCAINKELAIED